MILFHLHPELVHGGKGPKRTEFTRHTGTTTRFRNFLFAQLPRIARRESPRVEEHRQNYRQRRICTDCMYLASTTSECATLALYSSAEHFLCTLILFKGATPPVFQSTCPFVACCNRFIAVREGNRLGTGSRSSGFAMPNSMFHTSHEPAFDHQQWHRGWSDWRQGAPRTTRGRGSRCITTSSCGAGSACLVCGTPRRSREVPDRKTKFPLQSTP